MADISTADVEALVAETTSELIHRYRSELTNYKRLDDDDIELDISPMSRWHSAVVLGSLGTGYRYDAEVFRNSAVRRFYQGIPLQELMLSYELWAVELWRSWMRSGSAYADAAMSLELSGSIAHHVDTAKSAVARVYSDESAGQRNDTRALRPDLLEELISTDHATDFIGRITKTLRLDFEVPHTLILIRPREPADITEPMLVDVLDSVQHALSKAAVDVAVSGIHHNDIVAICAVEDDSPRAVLGVADGLARMLPESLVGVSRPYYSTGGFAHGYVEAQNSIVYAPSRAKRRAYSFSDAIVNRVLRKSDLTEELKRATIDPIEKYDREHGSDLLVTLQTYADEDFRLNRAASVLHVQPNTVRYRLRRIQALTGHDPLSSHGIFVLLAGMRLLDPAR